MLMIGYVFLTIAACTFTIGTVPEVHFRMCFVVYTANRAGVEGFALLRKGLRLSGHMLPAALHLSKNIRVKEEKKIACCGDNEQ